MNLEISLDSIVLGGVALPHLGAALPHLVINLTSWFTSSFLSRLLLKCPPKPLYNLRMCQTIYVNNSFRFDYKNA